MSRRSSVTGPNNEVIAETSAQPYLFLAFDSNHPKQPTWRHRLGGIDEIRIGRSRNTEIKRVREGNKQSLIVRFPDPWMSTDHARIERSERGAIMTDPGSKNGSFVNGIKRDSAVLTDGDLLQFGHTFFVYRDALPVQADEPFCVTSDMDAPPGLGTVLAPLAQSFLNFAQAALSDDPLLIVGERGTGKHAVARSAHVLSGRTGQFVTVNADARSTTQVLRQLCGNEQTNTEGAAVAARDGTLLVHSLDTLPRSAQAALLRILREGQVMPEGGTEQVPVTCRLIATCRQDPEDLVAGGDLDRDLVAMLSGFALRVPPLRQRREDLGMLVAGMLDHYAPEQEVSFSADAAYALFCYPWPRNLRELENCIATALALGDAKSIDVAHLPPELQRPFHLAQDTGGDTLDTIELSEQDLKKRAEIIATLRARSGDLVTNADTLLKARSQFQDWLKRRQVKLDKD